MFRHGELWRRVHAFGNEVAQTDDSVIVEATRTSALPHSKQINLGLLWGPRFESKQMINSYLITFLGVHAFGNEIAQTDDFVIVEATRTSALPHSKQINLGLLWGPRLLPLEGRSGFALGTRFESKQTKCAVWDAMRSAANGDKIYQLKITPLIRK